MFRKNLNITPREVEAHLQALEDRGVATDYAGQFAFLYEALSILDAKASSLLTFNAVGLAALAIWLGKIPLNLFHLALDVAFLLFLISCGICLAIVSLHWVSTKDLREGGARPAALLSLRETRTMLYRWAWLLAVVAVAITGLMTVHHTFETFFTVVYDWKWHLATAPDSPGL